MDADARRFFETRFAADLSSVRLHTGPEAKQSAGEVNARAYAVDNHIVLGEGQPSTNRTLMAHELTHVLQQSDGVQYLARQPNPSPLKKKDPVVSMKIGAASGNALFITASGTEYKGSVDTDLEPGFYTAYPRPYLKNWRIAKTKPGLRFHVEMEGVDPWMLAYADRIALDVVTGEPQRDEWCDGDTCFAGGTQEYDDPSVEIRTGVTRFDLRHPLQEGQVNADSDGILIRNKCISDPANPVSHKVQFISREIIQADATRRDQKIKTSARGEYRTTADPAHPNWHTDSATSEPFYESGFLHITDKEGELITMDQPGLLPGPGETWRATFKSYVFCGPAVREITWIREQKFGAEPEYKVLNVAELPDLPDWAKAQLSNDGYQLPLDKHGYETSTPAK